MKKRVLIPLVVLALFFTATPMVAAPATKTTFAAEMTLKIVYPGRVWTTRDGIRQVKGAVAEGNIIGDLTGSLRLTEDSTLDLNTGEGFSHGKVVMTTAVGTFEGSFVGVTTAYLFISGKALGHGTGAYEGQKIMASFEGHGEMINGVPTTIASIEGIILSPQG